MRIVLLIIFPLLYSCSEKKTENKALPVRVPAIQKSIQNLVDNYKADYKNATSDSLRNEVKKEYDRMIYTLLSEKAIDSMRVTLDSVIVNGFKITTKAHCNRDIAFQYSLTFINDMTPRQDSLFQFMKNLKQGSDTLIGFSYMGNHGLNNPLDNTQPVLILYAFPTPLLIRQ